MENKSIKKHALSFQENDKPDVMIIGTGAVGTALAVALAKKHYPILGIVSRQLERAEKLASLVGSPFAFLLTDHIPIKASLIFLCIPDDTIAATARLLAGNPAWQDKIVAHTSGALSSSVLRPLAIIGAHVMSFHPVQTFSNTAESPFADIYIGLEGDDEAVQAGVKVARDLGSRDLVLSAAFKPRYHLAASIASNFFVTLMAMACDVLESIGMRRDEAITMLRPLVTQTCTNVTSNLPEQALTGPASRGDIDTLNLHLHAIRTHLPQYGPLYEALLAETLELAHKDGRLSREKIESIKSDLL